MNIALAIAGGSLVAVLVGVLLGQSAIGGINPIYFQPVEPVRVYQPPPQTQDGFAQGYGWDNGQVAMAADCGANCLGGTYAYTPPEMRTDGPYWRDSSPTTELPPWPPGQVSARPIHDNIERYAHYPVEEDEPAAAPAPKALTEEPPPAEEAPAAPQPEE